MQSQKAQVDQFVQLITEQERLIYKVCNLYAQDEEDKKDLFQEVVLQAWSAYGRFRAESKPSTWLYRIALNTAIGHIRKTNRHKHVTYPELLQIDIADTSDTSKEEYKILQQLIGDLPPLEKALIILYLEDRSYQEIAEIMGLTVTNVGTRLGRIKEKLKKNAQSFIQS